MVHDRGQVEVDRRVTDAFTNMPHAVLGSGRATDEVRGCRRFTVTMTNAAAQATSAATPCNTRWNEEPSRGATFAASST